MLRRLKILFTKALLRLIDKNLFIDLIGPDLIEKKIDNKNLNLNKSRLILSHKSVLHPESRIFNIINKPDRIQVGEGTHIRGELLVFKSGGQIRIGNNCYVGEGTRIWSGEAINIGDNVLISHNCNIIDTNSHELNSQERSEGFKNIVANGHPSVKGNIDTNPIIIKNNAWINFNVTILKGVTIGKGAIVGAGSVVTKDVPDWAIVAGNPAQVIRLIPESER